MKNSNLFPSPHGKLLWRLCDNFERQVFILQGRWIFLTFLEIDKTRRSQGNGTALLTDFIKFANGRGMPIILNADPFETKHREPDYPAKQASLAAWYQRFGFSHYECGAPRWMTRPLGIALEEFPRTSVSSPITTLESNL